MLLVQRLFRITAFEVASSILIQSWKGPDIMWYNSMNLYISKEAQETCLTSHN